MCFSLIYLSGGDFFFLCIQLFPFLFRELLRIRRLSRRGSFFSSYYYYYYFYFNYRFERKNRVTVILTEFFFFLIKYYILWPFSRAYITQVPILYKWTERAEEKNNNNKTNHEWPFGIKEKKYTFRVFFFYFSTYAPLLFSYFKLILNIVRFRDIVNNIIIYDILWKRDISTILLTSIQYARLG